MRSDWRCGNFASLAATLSKLWTEMRIFTIEPAEEPNHEEYTFYCSRCERQKVIVVKCATSKGEVPSSRL